MTLFPEGESRPSPLVPEPPPAAPRVLEANRTQVLLRPTDLESLLPADHPARNLWACAERLDLTAFYAPITAVEGVAGRPAIDPKILLTLWLYATSEGVGSARELARLCEAHDAYRWLCGGVQVNHHTLSDFRVAHQAALDTLLTETLAVLLQAGLVTLTTVAHDGTRVRASAGAASFRRAKSLRRCLAAAQEQVQRCAAGVDAPASARQAAAQGRAARERQARVEAALAQLPAVRAAKRTAPARRAARVSTTDPEARVMKMADGGFRPAYNVQVATDTATQVIVGVGVTNRGNDEGQTTPMLDAVATRCGRVPPVWLTDGGFVTSAAIADAAERGVTVYAPVLTRADIPAPHAPRPRDRPAVAAWRIRMGTAAGKARYRARAPAECVNALWKDHRGLHRVRVRGLAKVLCLALWMAVTHNLLRWVALTQAAGEAAGR
jgi:transposase